MTLQDAINLLSGMQRHVLADYAFGDSEYHWTDAAGQVVAEGYSGSRSYVLINNQHTFEGDDAHRLQACGQRGSFTRNDEGEGS